MEKNEIQEFINMMDNTMFAKCNIQVPYEIIETEFNDFIDRNKIPLMAFQTHPKNPIKYNLDVLSLIDIDTDPSYAGTYIGDKFKFSQPTATILKEYFPRTIEWLFETMPGIIRCKISRLPGQKSVAWHYHPHKLPKLDGVFHIPIVTNPGVKMYTRPKDDPNSIQSCHFSPGNLWWFNSSTHIEHSVGNWGHEDRWHLWINTRIIDNDYNIVGNNILYDSLLNSTKF